MFSLPRVSYLFVVMIAATGDPNDPTVLPINSVGFAYCEKTFHVIPFFLLPWPVHFFVRTNFFARYMVAGYNVSGSVHNSMYRAINKWVQRFFSRNFQNENLVIIESFHEF